MFTGIIEETGRLESTKKNTNQFQLTFSAQKVLVDVKLGDSIAVNGTCLTVTYFTKQQFTADVMPETLRATSLGSLKKGSVVNLERAMAAGGRFGGHFVSGHVDGVAILSERRKSSNAVYHFFNCSEDLLRYMVSKGSVAVDGISLTLVDVMHKGFSVSIIPHTMEGTNLPQLKLGDMVNIECDMLAKYMEGLLTKHMGQPSNHPDANQQHREIKKSPLEKKLRDYGFIQT